MHDVCGAGQQQAKAVPVTMNEMLLRGCTLKNTGYILGLAVYTGNETRIQKNSAKTPNKIGQLLHNLAACHAMPLLSSAPAASYRTAEALITNSVLFIASPEMQRMLLLKTSLRVEFL